MRPNPDGRAAILIVDDQPANLLALEAILAPMGEDLVRASSGKEALRAMLDREFAVVLLDVRMPEMSGFETAGFIRGRLRTRHTPIIFVTAYSPTDTGVLEGYMLGGVDFLFKPIN